MTHNFRSVFYLGAALRFIHASLIWSVLPESLTTVKMQRASLAHRGNSPPSDQLTMLQRFQSLFSFLEPLSILLPEKISDENSAKVWRDGNLTFVVLSFGAMLLAAVGSLILCWLAFIINGSQSSILNQFLYALLTFDWDAEYLGYCISTIGIARATFLIVILPSQKFSLVKNRCTETSSPHSSSEREPLLSNRISSDLSTQPKAVMFDLRVAQFSILVDIAMHVRPIAIRANGNHLHIVHYPRILRSWSYSRFQQFYTRKIGKNKTVELGKLFGALSVLQAVCNTLGPPMYGFIYWKTVSTNPRIILFVAVGNSVFALVFLAFVRVPPDVDGNQVVA
ncbi:hypothetical protein B0H19DRAFT_1067311 [Mycena capillaripes]|nr:hypothetical protein B0H19DRAFT_1067311 [Mycena capillaripes]